MDKRGQVTVFVIVGIVILILAVLVWYLRDTGKVAIPTNFLGIESDKERIESNIHECAGKAVRPTVELAAKQGGMALPTNYRLYKGIAVPYLCMDIPGKKECYNIMPPLRVLEDKLGAVISQQIDNCVDRSILDGMDVQGTRNLNSKAVFTRDAVFVYTDYDVTLTKNGVQVPIGTVKTVVQDVPFADLYDACHEIVNSEATIGDFEQLFYMLQKHGRYIVQVDRPYPDKIYIINKKDSDFIYQFAVQGEDTTANL